MNTYTDSKGRTWQKFAIEYKHEVDDMVFVFDIWAIDWADAEERLNYINQNGHVLGRIE